MESEVGSSVSVEPIAVPARQNGVALSVLGAISFSHLLNDMIQSLILAIYPLLKGNFQLSFSQIGLITLTYQATASLLQPVVGIYTDRRPQPLSLPGSMGFTLAGIVLMSWAGNFSMLLLAAALVGIGSSIFHPESSRVARMASGGRHGLAQSLFQVGGNFGTALGPMLAVVLVMPYGQRSMAWCALAALLALFVLIQVGRWYARHLEGARGQSMRHAIPSGLSRRQTAFAVGILLLLIFSKFFYVASIGNYFIFYLFTKFHLSVQVSQTYLFIFLMSVAVGTVAGGPIGDRIGRHYVVWVSILGVAPFTMLLPYANLMWTGVLVAIIGVMLASAFPAILVYAQELMPGKIGTISGLFFGFAFGMSGIGAAVLGQVADRYGIETVYHLCSFLPLLGICAWFLPALSKK